MTTVKPNPALARLGYGPNDRLVIFHADDVGMCHGANTAYLDLHAAGLLRAGSVMVPCPWSGEVLAAARSDPALDLGVHLTLTSEWEHYRWGAVSTGDPATGLLDAERRLHRALALFPPHFDAQAAVAEMRAQIELACAAGLDFTHLDTHMGAAHLPALIESYVELGFKYRVPVLLPRRADDYLRGLMIGHLADDARLAWAQEVEERGMPLPDWFRITPGYDSRAEPRERADVYEAILRALQPGLTYFSLHPNAPGDIETIAQAHAARRIFEHEYFRSQRLRDFLARERIIPIGYRELRGLMRG
jgi:predicted glycoside hydrolase/deacetylase ChbG (UPF0249 family)